MKVVIIHSPPYGEVPFRHIGLAYISTFLSANGYETSFEDISFEEDRKRVDYYGLLIRHLSEKVGMVSDAPDLRLLISLIYPNYYRSSELIVDIIRKKVDYYFKKLKDSGDIFLFSNNVLTMYFSCLLARRLREYGKITIGGGITTHYLPFTRLVLLAGVYDYVIVGEGEESSLHLLNSLKRKKMVNIPGLYYKNNGEIIGRGKYYNKKIIGIIPDFRGVVINDFIPIISGRGCPHRCRFCSETYYWNGFRKRGIQSVINEMIYQYNKYGIDNFHFHDDSINGNLKWFDDFTTGLIKKGYNFKWESFITPYGLNYDRLSKMRESGCVLMKMGVQSFSDRVLKLMGRPANSGFVKEVIRNAVKVGISMHYDILMGFPFESEEDHKINIKTVEELYNISKDLYFSPNPFYLSTGSFTMMNPHLFGIKVSYFSPEDFPEPIRSILRSSGDFPESFSYDINPKVIKKRLKDYHRILIKHNKDYQFLGRK